MKKATIKTALKSYSFVIKLLLIKLLRRLMKTKKQAQEIVALLEQTYPVADCFLDHEGAWQLLVAVRLSAQCTDLRVNATTPSLFEKFSTVDAFADAPLKEIEEIIKPCGLFKTKARDIKGAMMMLRDEYNYIVPDDMELLLRMPGVGRKSANLILGDIFKLPAIVADTHCIRISNRLGFLKSKDPYKVELALKKVVAKEKQNDLCHRFVEHGRLVCTARKAFCENCNLILYCDEYKKQVKALDKAK